MIVFIIFSLQNINVLLNFNIIRYNFGKLTADFKDFFYHSCIIIIRYIMYLLA